MNIDINTTNVVAYIIMALMGLITYFLKQTVDGIKKQIDALQAVDTKLSEDIHRLDKTSISRTDFDKFRDELKADHKEINKSLSEIMRALGKP